ncbi:family 43 glycosylhydrolase [Caulobacter segnis]
MIRVGDRYYLVASTFHFSPGLPVLESRDLVHWTILGHVLPRLPFAPEYDLPGPVPTDDAGASHAPRPADGRPALRRRRLGAVDPPSRWPLLRLFRHPL